ncbi:MAG: 4Fe-4S binding protein [Bacteroidales bacterium]|nr:4Fe-4S binding protein [Bacteroidales bacterium]
MKREIVTIDEELCNGCAECVPACHEGALQIIDGKARLVSDLMCDGLGACLGHCPQGAISIEEREAEPYDEVKVMEIMVGKGKNIVVAHMRHLKDHNETEFLKEAVRFLNTNQEQIQFDVKEVIREVYHSGQHHSGGGCPGSREISFEPKAAVLSTEKLVSGQSELRQWPVQMHLVNPNAGYFQQADVVLAADCVAFALGNFHQNYLKGKSLAIACPKLDSNQEAYMQKIRALINEAKVNTLHVMIMQVPCCGGLLQMVNQAVQEAGRKVPVKYTVVGIEGQILKEEWL